MAAREAAWSVAQIEKKPAAASLSPYTTPWWAVQVAALSSFCGVSILLASPASSTPSFIGSTPWVFYRVWTCFANLGLAVCHISCVYAPRALGVDCSVKSRVQTSHGGREGLVAVFVRQLGVASSTRKAFGVHRFRKPAFQSNSVLQSLVPPPLNRCRKQWRCHFCRSSTRIVDVVVGIPVETTDSTLVWIGGSIMSSRRKIGENTTNLAHHRPQEMLLFFTLWQISLVGETVSYGDALGRFRQFPVGPWRVPFSLGDH